MARRAALLPRGFAIGAFGMVLAACAPVGIAESWRGAFVKVYNRTLTTVSFDGGWVPICSMGAFSGLPPWPSPVTSPPPGTPRIAFDLDAPSDYGGVISVIVSERGVEVIQGEVAEGDLPVCSGHPPT
jgi:hypothetical protein